MVYPKNVNPFDVVEGNIVVVVVVVLIVVVIGVVEVVDEVVVLIGLGFADFRRLYFFLGFGLGIGFGLGLGFGLEPFALLIRPI